ncbi:hypothetical protein G9P44_004925 [Scheffersomyces stipitis]|nr:hypothetical protein G9P44_004925 [Scheffersomyces stipitis]
MFVSTNSSSTASYLATPPATPTLVSKTKELSTFASGKSLDEYYQILNIQEVRSELMPNMSKVKVDKPFTWNEVHFIVTTNQLELFARSQAATDRYLKFKHDLKESKVNILDHILANEVRWDVEDLREEGAIFADKSDLRIIHNRFPYYFEDDVSHLCVWSKVRIPTDPNSADGDITTETRNKINQYIEETFIRPLGLTWEQVEWFKNWTSLQSVKSISHIHVLIKGGDKNKIEQMVESV